MHQQRLLSMVIEVLTSKHSDLFRAYNRELPVDLCTRVAQYISTNDLISFVERENFEQETARMVLRERFQSSQRILLQERWDVFCAYLQVSGLPCEQFTQEALDLIQEVQVRSQARLLESLCQFVFQQEDSHPSLKNYKVTENQATLQEQDAIDPRLQIQEKDLTSNNDKLRRQALDFLIKRLLSQPSLIDPGKLELQGQNFFEAKLYRLIHKIYCAFVAHVNGQEPWEDPLQLATQPLESNMDVDEPVVTSAGEKRKFGANHGCDEREENSSDDAPDPKRACLDPDAQRAAPLTNVQQGTNPNGLFNAPSSKSTSEDIESGHQHRSI